MNENKKTGNPSDRGGFELKTGPQTQYAKPLRKRDGYIRQIAPKTISQTRSDIATWQMAKRAAGNVERPRRIRLQNLYKDIRLDAHLTSQIELRTLPVLATPGILRKADGTIAEKETLLINSMSWVDTLNRHILESTYEGTTVVEFEVNEDGELKVALVPRTNVVPEKGLLLLDQDNDQGIAYRQTKEFGSWLLEFGEPDDLGLLNKAVPHVLFMRFAQSCWSELCEIYGIPPRFIKTDTTDPEMLDRAEAMLRDMGAAAYFIIDLNEQFEFAKGADTNGDVYNNLMRVCKEALSVLINGGQVGQDTAHGNRSKEESTFKLLDNAQQADRRRLTRAWNEKVLPALFRIGVFAEQYTYELQQEEDIEKLWKMVTDILPYKDIPNEWIEKKFGIQVIDKPQSSFGMYNMTDPQQVGLFAQIYSRLFGYLPRKYRKINTSASSAGAAGSNQKQKDNDFFA